jgi:PAS domain S-box-containing protein
MPRSPAQPAGPRARYYLAGFLVFCGAVALLGARSYTTQRVAVDATWRRQLQEMADLKAKQVADWRAERLGDAAVAVADTPLMPAVRQVLAGTDSSEGRQRVLAWMDAMRANYQYVNVVLIDDGGRTRLASGRLLGSAEQYAALARGATSIDGVTLSDVPGPPAFTQPHLTLTVALRSGTAGRLGTLLLGIDPAVALYRSILVWPATQTGEVTVVGSGGGVSHPPLRRAPGVPALSASRQIPDSPWTVVASIDRYEADAPMRDTAVRLLQIIGVLVLLGGAGTTLAWRHQRSTFERQRHEAEIERRALRGHYEFLTRFGNDAIVLLDGDSMVVEVNDRAIEWFGYSREEFLTLHASQLRAPETAADFERTWEAVKRDKNLVFETMDQRKDGSRFPVEVSVRLIEIDGRQFCQSILRDISDRRRADDQIRRLNRLYAVLSGCSQAIVASRTEMELFDRVCRIAVTQGGFRLASISLVEAGTSALVTVARAGEGSGYIDRISLSTDGRFGQGVAGRSIRERQPVVCNDILTDPAMTPWTVEASRFGLRSSIVLPLRQFGRDIGVLGLYAGEPGFFDEAEAKLAEEVADSVSFALDSLEQDMRRQQADAELRVSRDRLERVLDAIDEGYWDWHPATGDLHVSARYHTMLGYVPGELEFGWDAWIAMAHPEDAPIVEAAFKRFLESRRESFSVEYRMRCKSGGYIWVLSRGKVVDRDGDGMPIRLVGTNTDITERKKLEDQFLQAQKLESVGRLAGGIAHDFNNLLTVINGYSEIVLSRLGAGDPNWTHVDAVRQAGDRAAGLTQQLLAFSRKQATQPRALRLNAVVAEYERLLRRLVGEDIELLVRLDAEADAVVADPSQLHQVVMNLVVNARDAMPSGGRVLIQTSNTTVRGDEGPDVAPGPYVVLSVSDTGIGMDDETRAQIFEPFFTTKERGKGTGLGLSTVYGVVHQSGGFIQVESRVGKGTRFAVHLPRTMADVAPVAGGPRPERPVGSETILIAEDQPHVLALATEALQALGYAVLAAADGAEALHLAGRHAGPIHVLLTDVVMPGLDGKAVAERLAVTRPDTKVIFTSGYTDDVIGLRGVLDAGVAYLPKPFTADTLGAKIREVLGAGPAARRTPRGDRRTVLVVDDDENVRNLFVECLDRDYRVLHAGDGEEAVSIVRREHALDLLITDLFMPKQEGLETIQAVRALRPGMRVIAISGAFGGQFLKTAERLGVDATLLKPIRLDTLRKTVDDVLSRTAPLH